MRADGYYYYQDPLTNKTFGLGKNRAAAIAQAAEAVMRIAARRAAEAAPYQARLAERIETGAGGTFSEWLKQYRMQLGRRNLATSTRNTIMRHLATAEETFGHLPIASITTRLVAEYLQTWIDEGKDRMAQAVRSQLYEVFRAGIASGWIETNPVEATRVDDIKVKRERMSIELWRETYNLALNSALPWLPRLLELALLTAQRREDLRDMRYRDIQDGHLQVEQGKTGARIRIPLGLRLAAVNLSLAETIERTRAPHVLSQYLIHHCGQVGRAKPGDQLRAHTLAGEVAALVKATGYEPRPGHLPPSLHEIRSLAARLWADQHGPAFAQALLGHKSADMTALYRDVRGSEWITPQVRG